MHLKFFQILDLDGFRSFLYCPILILHKFQVTCLHSIIFFPQLNNKFQFLKKMYIKAGNENYYKSFPSDYYHDSDLDYSTFNAKKD